MAHTTVWLLQVVLLFALLSAGGCIYSERPLSPGDPANPDRDLAGLWRIECEPADVTYFHVLISHRGHMRLVRVTHPGEKSTTAASVDEFSIFPTVRGKTRILNVAVPVPDEKTRAARIKYMFFIYGFKDRDTLTVSMPSYEAAESSIKADVLKGKVWETTWGSNAVLDDTPEKLTLWLTSLRAENGLVPFGTLSRIQ